MISGVGEALIGYRVDREVGPLVMVAAGGIASRLTEFPGVGPTGASIFLREAQEVWPGVAPYVDAKVTSGAHRVRLPADRESLAGLLAASGQPARLAAALVRVSLSQRAASEVTASVRD